jgi:hypothetical protein
MQRRAAGGGRASGRLEPRDGECRAKNPAEFVPTGTAPRNCRFNKQPNHQFGFLKAFYRIFDLVISNSVRLSSGQFGALTGTKILTNL